MAPPTASMVAALAAEALGGRPVEVAGGEEKERGGMRRGEGGAVLSASPSGWCEVALRGGLLVVQAALYGIAYSFLAYLGVGSPGVYVSIMAIIYLVTVTAYGPLPRRVRRVNYVVTAALVAAFAYYAAIQLMKIIS